MSGSEHQPEAAAEAAFAAYLSARQGDGGVDFEAFCAERPDIAERLRTLHMIWSRQATATMLESSPGEAARPISQVLRDYFGSAGAPGIDLDDAKERSPDSSLEERLQRLAERIALTTRYSLREEMARGGMGVILRVWDEDLRRTLAMKSMRGMLLPKDASPENAQMVSRFLEEAQITGQLDHPGVVPVHELGIDAKGHVFFTMRMVRGVELAEVIRMAREGREGWNTTRALTVILKVCEAMAYAHSKGVIHRDLKPANVMVGKFGESYVMDWGLAKVVDAPTPTTSASIRAPPPSSVACAPTGSRRRRTSPIRRSSPWTARSWAPRPTCRRNRRRGASPISTSAPTSTRPAPCSIPSSPAGCRTSIRPRPSPRGRSVTRRARSSGARRLSLVRSAPCGAIRRRHDVVRILRRDPLIKAAVLRAPRDDDVVFQSR
ncbi:MAG: serine/threonine protein kinase, partial [Planctomycetes bacterium]|nr:serine/threonine protein kinase [Planctomycetota bacterium]